MSHTLLTFGDQSFYENLDLSSDRINDDDTTKLARDSRLCVLDIDMNRALTQVSEKMLRHAVFGESCQSGFGGERRHSNLLQAPTIESLGHELQLPVRFSKNE